MEKVEGTYTSERYLIGFYCDHCGKKIGDAEEFDDGYIPTPDNAYELRGIDLRFHGLMTNQKDHPYHIEFRTPILLCEDCYNKMYDEYTENDE